MSKSMRNWITTLLSLVFNIGRIIAWVLIAIGPLLAAGLAISLLGDGKFKLLSLLELDADPKNWQAILVGAIGSLILGIIILVIATAMRRMIATLEAGDPFVPENARRIRVIAGAVGALTLTSYAAQALTHVLAFFFGRAASLPPTQALDLNVPAWVAVLILLVLAQVFDEGARLRAADQMTI